jgi:hypothetical protein
MRARERLALRHCDESCAPQQVYRGQVLIIFAYELGQSFDWINEWAENFCDLVDGASKRAALVTLMA